MVERAKDFVKKCTTGDASGHDYFHTLRVLELSRTLAQAECENSDVDMDAVQLIALLHDVDDRKLSPDTCKNQDRARTFLMEQGLNGARIEWILLGIRQISFKGKDSVSPDSLEARIVQDADRLDAIGAIGIARTFAFGGERKRPLSDSVQHFHEKLLLLKGEMITKEGLRLAESRHRLMEQFLQER